MTEDVVNTELAAVAPSQGRHIATTVAAGWFLFALCQLVAHLPPLATRGLPLRDWPATILMITPALVLAAWLRWHARGEPRLFRHFYLDTLGTLIFWGSVMTTQRIVHAPGLAYDAITLLAAVVMAVPIALVWRAVAPSLAAIAPERTETHANGP